MNREQKATMMMPTLDRQPAPYDASAAEAVLGVLEWMLARVDPDAAPVRAEQLEVFAALGAAVNVAGIGLGERWDDYPRTYHPRTTTEDAFGAALQDARAIVTGSRESESMSAVDLLQLDLALRAVGEAHARTKSAEQ